jgi:hypothetical protein
MIRHKLSNSPSGESMEERDFLQKYIFIIDYGYFLEALLKLKIFTCIPLIILQFSFGFNRNYILL